MSATQSDEVPVRRHDPQLLRFSFDEVRRAPRQPGLYAWYGQLTMGATDWADERTFREKLAAHTRRFTTPVLKLQAKTTFRRSWQGKLDETTSAAFDRMLGMATERVQATRPEDEDPADREDARELKTFVDRICASRDRREELSRALNVAIPMLSSPLYVGISRNLRNRLGHHARAVDRFLEHYPTAEEQRSLLAQDSEFAARAVGSGFRGDMLLVYCLPLPADTVDEADDMIHAVEFFLNRWHFPPFGRR